MLRKALNNLTHKFYSLFPLLLQRYFNTRGN